ncbi:Late embryogenesis abundant protein [Hirschfeldia incana]|nr:Late embryogenesis abundant protein [Hirschfeldia incana]
MSQQSFNAGQTRGHAQEKAEQWTESAKQTAQSACDKTADAALSARDKTANLTQSTHSKSADASHSTRESAQHGQEQAAGFLGQTGESVKNMAQGAYDGVKNSLGMNDKK